MSNPTMVTPPRGRGASTNPANRYTRLQIEPAAGFPDDLDTTYFRDTSRSVIARNKSPDVPFEASLNPYRGCEHGCIYCYARPTHEHLGMSAGLDFETKILIKENAPELLRVELASPRWKPQLLALSGVTDPYQPVERRLELTRRCLEVLAEYRNPVGVGTKNALVTRDIDLLQALAQHQAASVMLSITTLDNELASRMEPRTGGPKRRLEALSALAAAGVPCGVLIAPVIPGLTDHEIPRLIAAAAEAGAGYASMVMLRLPGAVAGLFDRWLQERFPDRRNKILGRLRSLRDGRLNDPRFGSRMRGGGVFADQIRALFETAGRRSSAASWRGLVRRSDRLEQWQPCRQTTRGFAKPGKHPGGSIMVLGAVLRRRAGNFFVLGSVIAASALSASMVPPASPCSSPANDIVAENCRPGAPPTEWDVNGSGDPGIRGFADNISVDHGETISFKIDSRSDDYRLDIYRMGYYSGMGARRVATVSPSVTLPQLQPDCLRDQATRLVDCGNWAFSASWDVPADATSGIYFARIVRQDSGLASWRADNSQLGPDRAPQPSAHAYGALGHGRLANALHEPRASHVFFIVRDDDGGSAILFQTADTTWQAYNRYGGTSTYGTFDPARPAERAYKVSYNRPFVTRDYRAVNMVFNAEYPMVRWLEANGYDVSYSTGVDSARRGEEILEHQLFLSVGHDEYWSGKQRQNVESARAAGVNLAFFSGNEVFWKIRWEDAIDGSGDPYRTMVTYKETHAGAKIDPAADVWTGTWRDSRAFNPEGPQPENALTGTIFTVNAWRNDALQVTADYARLRFWRHTDIARLRSGETATLLKGILGHEWDEDLDNGHRPPGLMRLSETTVNNVRYIQDHGSVYDAGTATHHLTLYRHSSGALVFGAGTVQWSWGLDAHHDTETGVPPERANPYTIRVGIDPNGPDRVVRQATVNLFADMGIQPAQLLPGLVRPSASTDRSAPSSTIAAPSGGALLLSSSTSGSAAARSATVRGTATDVGGGVVAGVEVSIDGGHRWHPAQGRDSWSYSWVLAPETTAALIMSRAVDDSGNLENPAAGVRVRLENGAQR